jgi:hypothetical protein
MWYFELGKTCHHGNVEAQESCGGCKFEVYIPGLLREGWWRMQGVRWILYSKLSSGTNFNSFFNLQPLDKIAYLLILFLSSVQGKSIMLMVSVGIVERWLFSAESVGKTFSSSSHHLLTFVDLIEQSWHFITDTSTTIG